MSSKQIPQSHDLTVEEAAAKLAVDRRFIRRRIADGTLPAYRIKGSRFIRIPRAGLEALKQPIGSDVA